MHKPFALGLLNMEVENENEPLEDHIPLQTNAWFSTSTCDLFAGGYITVWVHKAYRSALWIKQPGTLLFECCTANTILCIYTHSLYHGL